jgi:hypothetical protein
MTRVSPWVQNMVEDVIGGAPVQVGKRYAHPTDGIIKVTSGQYWGEHGLSNFWYWRVESTGETRHGYGEAWPEVVLVEETTTTKETHDVQDDE